jgi:hypothetical protein
MPCLPWAPRQAVRFPDPQLIEGEGSIAMDVSELLRQAAAAVDRAELPPEFRATGFAKAVDLLLAGAAAASVPTRLPGTSAPPRLATPGDVIGRIAERLQLSREAVDHVYALDGENVDVVVASSRLGASKRKGTQEIAVLMSAGRQAVGLEEWTAMAPIRSVAEAYKRYDGPNFAKHVRALDGECNFQGTAQQLRLRLTRAGWEAARALVARLAGVDG